MLIIKSIVSAEDIIAAKNPAKTKPYNPTGSRVVSKSAITELEVDVSGIDEEKFEKQTFLKSKLLINLIYPPGLLRNPGIF